MNTKFLSTSLLTTSLFAALTTGAANASTKQVVCQPVSATVPAESPPFLVKIHWGAQTPANDPLGKTKQSAFVSIEGKNGHASGPVNFYLHGISTRCEAGHTWSGKLGNLGVLNFTTLSYKIGCGGHENGTTLTLKPNTPQQITYKLQCQ